MNTSLFNLFGPLFMNWEIEMSLILLISCSLAVLMLYSLTVLNKVQFSLFPSLEGFSSKLFLNLFSIVVLLNLYSLINFSYPVTTTLTFNLSLALIMWLVSVLIYLMKYFASATLLPENSPSYLAPFLALVEFVSISVRPLTLSFRLLANMSAGHVLLSLFTKLNFVWMLGSMFGLLELLVCAVQGFVLLMLTMVYLEESFSHSMDSFLKTRLWSSWDFLLCFSTKSKILYAFTLMHMDQLIPSSNLKFWIMTAVALLWFKCYTQVIVVH